jgi:AcrR family transcriptional regulator
LGESPSIPTSETWSPAKSVGVASARFAAVPANRTEQAITAQTRRTQPATGGDIAGAVGIRESAIYKHYAGKDAILQAIFAYAEARIYAPLPPAQNTAGRDESSIFRDMLEGLPRFMMADPTLIKITRIMLTEMHHDRKVNEYVQGTYGERAHMYTEALFKKQMEEGKIRPCDARALAMIFNGFRFFWVYWTFLANNPSPGDIDQAEKDLQSSIKLFEELLKP